MPKSCYRSRAALQRFCTVSVVAVVVVFVFVVIVVVWFVGWLGFVILLLLFGGGGVVIICFFVIFIVVGCCCFWGVFLGGGGLGGWGCCSFRDGIGGSLTKPFSFLKQFCHFGSIRHA